MSKLTDNFFAKIETPAPMSAPSTPAPADASAFFIFAPSSAPAAPPRVNHIPHGSTTPDHEPWSETIEIDFDDVTACPTCKSFEHWIDLAGDQHCMRCTPLKIQRMRNWMNRRELLLNIHAQQREADERSATASADRDPSADPQD
jgi:hypothetical protein